MAPTNLDLFGDLIPHRWLPDETLFSLCSRHHFLSSNYSAATTSLQLFGHRRNGLSHDFPGGISQFCKSTHEQLGNAEAVIRQHTLLPYYLPFASAELAADAIKTLCTSSIGSLKFRFGILTSGFRANHPLKACEECMAYDRQHWSVAYWHIQHQLPGAWVCLKHRSPLLASNLKATGVQRFQWLLPSKAHLLYTSSCDSVTEGVHLISSLANALYRLPPGTTFDQATLARTYRQRLQQIGLITQEKLGRIQVQKVGGEYAQFVESLCEFNEFRSLPNTPDKAACEVRRMVSKPRNHHHPIRHLAMIAWLFRCMPQFISAYRHAASQHDQLKPRLSTGGEQNTTSQDAVKHEFFKLTSSGTAISSAARQLGLDPVTGMAWATNAGIQARKRPSLLKGEVRKKMIGALRKGATKEDAAKIGNVSIQSVTRLLRTEVGLRKDWVNAKFSAAQSSARGRWLAALKKNPLSGVKGNRITESAAYAWLYRNDRDWLNQQNQLVSVPNSVSRQRVDWTARDKELAQEVIAACINIVAKNHGKKIKLWQIYQSVPCLKAKLAHLDRLPLTLKTIENAMKKFQNNLQFQ